MATQSIPYSLHRREALRPGLVRILNAMGQSARKLSERPESEAEKSIHDIRTLTKRLRAYLWFLRPVIGKTLHAHGNSCLRKAARRLSKTRDLHAVGAALGKAAISIANENHLHALVQVSQAFAQQTAEAQKKVPPTISLEKTADTIIQTISKVTKTLKQDPREIPSPVHRLKKIYKRTRKTRKESMLKKDSRLVHEWRKKTKRLFYILQLTGQLPHIGMTDCLKKVGKLQEKLGDFQDHIVAENHLRQQPPEVKTACVKKTLHLLRKRRKTLLKEAYRCWDSILGDVQTD